MSTPAPDLSRIQTRAKNANEHPGDVIRTRKRRTKAQMAEFREKQRLEQEEKKMAVTEQLQAAAKLEDAIAASDKKAAAGVVTKKGKATILATATIFTTAAKKFSAQVPVQEVVPNHLALDVDFEHEEMNEVEMASDDEDNEALADSVLGVDDGNATDMGEFTEDDEQPRKTRKTQRGDTREVISMHRKVTVMSAEKEAHSGHKAKVSTSDKPTGVIENWTKDVVQSVTKSMASGSSIVPPSVTLVTRMSKNDKKKAASSNPPSTKRKKAAKVPPKLFLTVSDEEFPDIRVAASDVLTPAASGIVSVDPEEEGGMSQMGAKNQKRWNNTDLPAGCQESNVWRRVFIPTFFSFVAAYEDPWVLDDKVVTLKLQLIWNKIYNLPGKPIIDHSILPSQAVFGVSTQRACEWRAGFGSSALTFLNAFFANNPGFETDEARVLFSQEQLKDFKFLYEKAEGQDKTKYRGLFLSAIVLQTFAHHFDSIAGAINVAGLHKDGSDPRGALALAAAAAERAFRLWASGSITVKSLPVGKGSKTVKTINAATGNDAGREATFSEEYWGLVTRTYLVTVKNNLRGDSFPKIVANAQALAKVARRAGDFTMTLPSTDPDLLDERAQLLDMTDD